jgi:hypothetical protein
MVYKRLGGIRSKGRAHLEDPVVEGRKILKLISRSVIYVELD